jgi:hypothetical protein
VTPVTAAILHADGSHCHHGGPPLAGSPPRCPAGHEVTRVRLPSGTVVTFAEAFAAVADGWSAMITQLAAALGVPPPGPRADTGDPCGDSGPPVKVPRKSPGPAGPGAARPPAPP